MRFHRPVGIYLLLWPTLWALCFAAGGPPSLHVLLVFVLGTVLMRGAGCAINDFADRDFDGHVARTRERPLAAGELSAREAVWVFVAVSLLAFVLLLSLRNIYAIVLSVPAVILAAAYPFAKRVLSIPQAILGLAFSAGIPMAFAAVRGEVDWGLSMLLVAANLCWVIAYDTYYAMADRADDLKIGVRSSAILFGRADLAMTALLQAVALALLLLAGLQDGRGAYYFAGLVAAAAVALHVQWRARSRAPADCFAAFLRSHWFGVAVLAGLVADHGV